MARYIDADELIEYLKEENRQIVNDAKRHNISSDTVYGMQIAIQAFTNKVNHMPTAYDMDAVVSELRELQKTNFEAYEVATHIPDKIGYINTSNAYANAINIVKRGGSK